MADLAADLPDTRLVSVADREADSLELMVCARDLKHPADWLLRAKHNRALPDDQDGKEDKKLWDTASAASSDARVMASRA